MDRPLVRRHAQRIPLSHFAVSVALIVSTGAAPAAATGHPREPEAARALLERTIGRSAASQFDLRLVEHELREREGFSITGRVGRIRIEATSPSALTQGIGWYLKYIARASVNLGSGPLNLPDRLPAPPGEITKSAYETNRFIHNDTHDGYTDPNLDWSGWQRLLDMYALHGINQVFVSVGSEAVYHELFQAYGYSAAEMNAWIPQPAHQPWWLLQNMSSDQTSLTATQLSVRADLARRIVRRAKELGITPVLPGYFGTVPVDFPIRNPGAKVIPQGSWVGYQRPGWLDPTTPLFKTVAADFYRISDSVIGASSAYKMDPLHEGGQAGDVDVPRAAAAIEAALQTAHPSALWVLLGWQNNPSAALLSGIADKSRLLIVDGLSDRYGGFDNESKWPGVPYTFGSIYNFGGHTTMGSNSQVWIDRYFAARSKPASQLRGVAIMPEGLYNNPVSFELLSELPWHESVDLTIWMREYAHGRYGTPASSAWEILRKTAYSMPADGFTEPQDSLFAAEPSLTATNATTWSPGYMRYDAVEFERALPALLEASRARQQPAYRYDLTDVTRQVIANRSRVLLPQIKQAYDAHDRAQFDELTGAWMDLIRLLDQVVATDAEFLLGPRLERARTSAGPASAAAQQYDLLRLYTVWGGRAGFDEGLGDYANREWQGLVGDFYAGRWRRYFDSLRTALTTGRPPAPIDWFAVGDSWAKARHRFPTEPSGDIVRLASEVIHELAGDPSATSLTVAVSAALVDEPVTVTATLRNVSGLPATVDSAALQLGVPAGLVATATSPTTVGQLGPGESATVTWSVSLDPARPPADVESALTVTARLSTGRVKRASGHVLAGSTPAAPWRTFSSGDAVFAEAGGRTAINTAGADMWGSTQQFGAVYRDDAMTDGTTATVRVDRQTSDGSRPWARSGILVSADLSTAPSPGTVNLAVTPANGCVLTWSGGTAGVLDQVAARSGFTAPVWLRLTRVGSAYRGECSSDGVTWTMVGTAGPGGVGTSADVGMFSSAANAWNTDRLTGVFSAWSLT